MTGSPRCRWGWIGVLLLVNGYALPAMFELIAFELRLFLTELLNCVELDL